MKKTLSRRMFAVAPLAGGLCLLQAAGCQVMPTFWNLIISNFVLAAVSQVANVIFANVAAVAGS